MLDVTICICSQEIVPLRKVCRRPETDYRLQQLHASNESGAADQQKLKPSDGGNLARIAPTPPEAMQKLHVGEVADGPPAGITAPEAKPMEICSTGNGENASISSENASVTGITSANAIAGNSCEKAVQG